MRKKVGIELGLPDWQEMVVLCSSCDKKLQPPGATYCPWCGARAPISAGSLEEDRDALRALRDADPAINNLLPSHTKSVTAEIDRDFGEPSDAWVDVTQPKGNAQDEPPPLRLKVPPAHVGSRATISGHWYDQGFGNQKGRLRLVLLRGGEQIAAAALPGCAPHAKAPFDLELELSPPSDHPGEKLSPYWDGEFGKNTKLERAQIDEITILDGEWFFRGAPTGIASGDHDKQARAGLKACNKDGTHGYGSAQTKAVEVAIGEMCANARAMPGDEIGVQIVVGGGGGHELKLRDTKVVLDASSTMTCGQESFVKLTGAGELSGRYLQIPGERCNKRLWWHKDGIKDEKGTGVWHNGEWRIGRTGVYWWTTNTDPPPSGPWRGWQDGTSNPGGLSSFQATVVMRVDEDERVTALTLDRCLDLVALPDEVGGLKALTELSLAECPGLVALPDTVGTLKSLKKLDLSGCSGLGELPDAIGSLEALRVLMLSDCSGLKSLPAAIGGLAQLRTLDMTNASIAALPDAIGQLHALKELLVVNSPLTTLPETIGELRELTELNLAECSSLTALPATIGGLGALTKLNLHGCWRLTALPDAIGELGALTTLDLRECWDLAALPDTIGKLGALTALGLARCSSLAVLPDSIGDLKELTELYLNGCSSLTFPPLRMHDNVRKIKRCLASVGPILDGALALEDAGADERDFFFAEVLKFPAYADRLGARVRKDPAFADLTNDKGQRVVELACFECRAQMQKALFLLGRYAVDKTPPLHFSATAAVLGATDHDKADVKPRRALKAMRRVDQVLAELDGRAGLDSKFVVAVVAVHVNSTVPAVDYKRIQHAARALDRVVVERAEGLGEDLAGLLAARERRLLPLVGLTELSSRPPKSSPASGSSTPPTWGAATDGNRSVSTASEPPSEYIRL